MCTIPAAAQVENAGGVRKRTEKERTATPSASSISERMQEKLKSEDTHEADLAYMKQVYRQLDLKKGTNGALYYPEDVVDGQENLFRIILKLVLEGKVTAYEYLDGHEIFTDQYKLNVHDLLNRFDIYAQEAKGSTEKNPKYEIDESDVPASQVQNYYILEKWEFDNRSNDMKTIVEAICPVLNKYGDFDDEVRYPMFWVKYTDIKPYLASRFVFIDDDNNLPKYSLDDFFTLNLYEGDIYKTRNMRNLSLSQMYPDEDDYKNEQDSIDTYLKNYGKNLWVPTREEYLASKKAQEEGKETVVEANSIDELKATSSRSKKKNKSKKSNKPKVSESSSSSTAEKSVRRRRK